MDRNLKLEAFLEKKSDKKKLIVIYGPTGSGKTSMSIDIAKYLQTEIISTDSRQIFKGLDIGTGKITQQEMQNIPHYMLDIINPDTQYSVGEYKQEAEEHINAIHKKGKIPILCGGTGLYIDSLIYDFDIPKVPADEQLREKLEQERIEKGNQYIWEKLNELDPEYAKELHPNNYRYVIRALEVFLITGKSKTSFRTEKQYKYDILFFTPYHGDREALYTKINLRVAQMFEEGLIEEVQQLLTIYSANDFGMKSIGYKEVVQFLAGEISRQDCLELVQKHNRNYAKRQITWFRKYEHDQKTY